MKMEIKNLNIFGLKEISELTFSTQKINTLFHLQIL